MRHEVQTPELLLQCRRSPKIALEINPETALEKL
jgi:hypothetical protein